MGLSSAIVATPPASRAIHPWDRQPGESDRAWHGFQTYLRLGEVDPTNGMPGRRMLSRVSELLGHASKTGVHEWSVTHDWIERASSWDAHIQARATAEVAETLAEVTLQHVKILRNAREVLAKQVEGLRASLEVAMPEEVSLASAMHTAKLVVELERLVHGASTGNLSVRGELAAPAEPQDFSALSDEELATVKALAAKLRGA